MIINYTLYLDFSLGVEEKNLEPRLRLGQDCRGGESELSQRVLRADFSTIAEVDTLGKDKYFGHR
ncbi:MAG TPA: hypothetical protein DCQ63_10950 [Planktothrix sp. UBA8402]|nr:hypothetical protein [Planktothrix sp. UBA8402]